VEFDSSRTASLDGVWDFFPGDHAVADLDRLVPEPIRVPGLWEAQGWLDLDGVAWYRTRFRLDDASGGWTLRFGAVMDMSDVWLNGELLGRHDFAFTPVELDPGPLLVTGDNELAVRVVDPALGDPDHPRMAHGKQGWANHVFPSRPSLYMTYGGIWQSVTLRRHGPVVIDDVFVNGDPGHLVVAVTVHNRGPARGARVGIRTLGMARELAVDVGPGGTEYAREGFGPIAAPRWTPDRPVLHDALVDVWVDGELSDSRALRYGLRTVSVDGTDVVVEDRPYRMKSVLVQGFRADTLYAEGTTGDIRREVAAAREMGFNTVRLHIKAFDPRYLDACDEMGMFVHCDIPVAEPIEHEEMGGETLLTRRSVEAARQQVRRDRNHPSILLWSAMNEICEGRPEARRWPAYEAFVRAVAGAVQDEDPTRPVIENDWVEPDPDQVFVSPILTAHWYGRLHRDYLDKLEAACTRWAGTGRVLFVTEFGDWGLPDMPVVPNPPFWDTREVYAADLVGTRWPGTVGRFALETQRYQGISDRLQAEVFRRHAHVGGYCLTELTDVPRELNGVLDLYRQPKPLAVAEIRRMNQSVLPMARLESLVVAAGGELRVPVYVANDGETVPDASVEARFGESWSAAAVEELLALDTSDLPPAYVERRFRETTSSTLLGDLPAHTVVAGEELGVVAPDVPGGHDLVVRLHSGSRLVAQNRYPVHVVDVAREVAPIELIGAGPTVAALAALGADPDGSGPLVVGEDALDAASGDAVRERLGGGGMVLVLAQRPEAAAFFPVPVQLEELTTVWGSTVFRFTTDHGAVPSLPRRSVLVAEDSTVQAVTAVASIDGKPFPDTPAVIAYKPVPGAMTGTVLGSHSVGAGRLVFCQYRLARRASNGDPAALAVLGDVLAWVTSPRPVMTEEETPKADGRRLIRYSWHEEVAR
jgi:hypothetical protein